MYAAYVVADLKKMYNAAKSASAKNFFKAFKGGYGEGDEFWGISVPNIRTVSKKYKGMELKEIETLLTSPVHEIRMCGLFILVKHYRSEPEKTYALYMKHMHYINNWDLVDLTAPHIVGAYLEDKDKTILYELAHSKNLWERRISILSTYHFIKKGRPGEALKIATILLRDSHDLIHKAVGWMLREIGKRCSMEKEEEFLLRNCTQMPRTMLRYAIERFPERKRQYYLKLE